ncbi:MAG TPA: HAD-IA family hydrolase [Solirubrobacteraceae bacterium]|nr:HAD-IA family hydrolase [Solirubrobacteraceae bacterium]
MPVSPPLQSTQPAESPTRRSPAPRVRAVLLDAHGTLLGLKPPAPALRALLAARFGIGVSLAQAEAAIAAEIRYYRAHLHEGRDERSVDDLRGRCSEVLRHALAAEHLLDGVGVGELTQTLLAALEFHPYPEVPDVLERLRARGIRLVVASNWDASLPHTLRALGLLEHLDGVVTSAECGAPKPEPPVFERALELAAVPASAALHVGDSREEDVLGARRAGVEAVLISRQPGPPAPGVRSISSLRELLGLPELEGP